MFKKTDDDKIERRDRQSREPTSLKPFIIVGIIAFLILIISVIYLCVAVLSKSPDYFISAKEFSLDKFLF